MIIKSSDISMQATHEKSVKESISYSSTVHTVDLKASNPEQKLSNFDRIIQQLIPSGTDTENIANSQNSILVMTENGLEFRVGESENAGSDQDMLTSMKLFKQLLDALFKQASQFIKTPENELNQFVDKSLTHCCQPPAAMDAGVQPPLSIQITLSMEHHYQESESLHFVSSGNILTTDGQEIAFSLDINESRQYQYSSSSSFTQTVAFKDPLIINYPGSAAQLSDQKYSFDIDADGNEELISYLTSGAMLALDKNNDGKINDGSELFGALSQNGFADLAAYDEDGNNFIDAGDSIFSELKLWTKTSEIDQLNDLSSMDIGAIYLGAIDTKFDLKGEDNQFNGRLISSGLYLTEQGGIGSVQQIDMVV
ncbi:MAG: hypothetical protein HRU05_11065 [Oceanospirillaceae bacterium]|nr:hypothetical protein [Oceanospirillaceae bacterium]